MGYGASELGTPAQPVQASVAPMPSSTPMREGVAGVGMVHAQSSAGFGASSPQQQQQQQQQQPLEYVNWEGETVYVTQVRAGSRCCFQSNLPFLKQQPLRQPAGNH